MRKSWATLDTVSMKTKQAYYTAGQQKPYNIPKGCENGFWVLPTAFTDSTDSTKIVREEIFGPVMCTLAYSITEEATARANATPLDLLLAYSLKTLTLLIKSSH